MTGEQAPKLPSSLIQAIEDAVLFGNIKEIDGLLDLVKEEPNFPENIRHALEALLFFRIHYGKGGAMEPVSDSDRQKAAQMESSWGRELIEMIGHYPDLTEMKYA
jgi:hypothetical protein